MKTDLYTKAVLTVIAAALVWIGLGGSALLPAVEAQAKPELQKVLIAGYVEKDGTPHNMENGLPIFSFEHAGVHVWLRGAAGYDTGKLGFVPVTRADFSIPVRVVNPQ